MEVSQYQLQIFTSLVVMLCAAFVALICDFLKGTNEQLRELAIELKVRHQEEERWAGKIQRSATAVIKPAPHESQESASPHVNPLGEGLPNEAPQAKPEPASPAPVKLKKIEVQPQTAAATPKRDWAALLRGAQAGLPKGFHPSSVLSRLIEKREVVSGLVVSVGVQARRAGLQTFMESEIPDLVRSLIGSGDFAARSGANEFVLIAPNEIGANAQRRLNRIAQQLWDFQLRSLGNSPLLFSWGGVEVRGETIEEAIASASERMYETQRSRKLVATLDQPTLRAM